MLLETQLDDLSESWIKMIRENENTASFRDLDPSNLHKYSHFVYQQLKHWLDWQITSSEVAKLFWQVGVDRKEQNIPLSEAYYAVILARRNLYINILEKFNDSDVTDMQELIAFTSRITYFFDKIGYFVIKGYSGLDKPTGNDEAALDEILTAFRAGSSPRS